jgi:hypothetical protein
VRSSIVFTARLARLSPLKVLLALVRNGDIPALRQGEQSDVYDIEVSERAPTDTHPKEEKRMRLYVLTSGQYSDHRVEAVFSTEVLAINYAEGVDNVNLPPEEYEVDGLEPTLERFWMVEFPSGGEVRISHGKWRDPDQLWQREEIISSRKTGDLHIYLFAATKERALKVASERRAQYFVEHT